MPGALIETTAHAVQQALTPVFLLTAIAGLLNVFASRLAQVTLQADALASQPETQAIDVRRKWLTRRALALDAAVLLSALACCCTCAVVFALFTGTSFNVFASSRLIADLFSAAVLLTMLSVIAFAVEMLGAAHGVKAADPSGKD